MEKPRIFLKMVRFEQTVFSLPFAYLGMVLAANWPPRAGQPAVLPTLHQFIWVTIALVAARTLALTINNLADRHLDSRNPRTADRPLPAGKLSLGETLASALVAVVVLAIAAWQLNTLTLLLLPGAILMLIGYSYTKRFTWLCHWILGATDGLAAAGAWVAVRAAIDAPAWFLWLALTLWVSSFDLIFACQDTEFDRSERLHSVPARFGNRVAFRLAQIGHAGAVLMLAVVGILMGLGWPYWLGLAVVAGLLIYEHSLVSPNDLSRLGVAFFNVNGYIAVVIFAATLLAVYSHNVF